MTRTERVEREALAQAWERLAEAYDERGMYGWRRDCGGAMFLCDVLKGAMGCAPLFADSVPYAIRAQMLARIAEDLADSDDPAYGWDYDDQDEQVAARVLACLMFAAEARNP